jgi:hypothetical protein
VRLRTGEDEGAVPIEGFASRVREKIAARDLKL